MSTMKLQPVKTGGFYSARCFSKTSNNIFIDELIKIDYPKEFISLCINNNYKYDIDTLKSHNYKKIDFENKNIDVLYNEIIQKEFDFLLLLTNHVVLKNHSFLKLLTTLNVDCISPLLARRNSSWSNFWGAIDDKGFYARSPDYFDIIKLNKKGLFKVPYISQCILLKKCITQKTFNFLIDNVDQGSGWDMAFCFNCRIHNIKMFIFNYEYFGYYLEEALLTHNPHKNKLNIFNINHPKWEEKYLHSDFLNFINNNTNLPYEEPISYAYDFPLFNEEFCQEIIKAAENENKWSSGVKTKNSVVDKRIGAVENVPTVDVHLKQIGLGNSWLIFLKKYMQKILEKFYPGTYVKGYNIAFIVKYEPSGQPSLKNHHDSSLYTLNIALNKQGLDFEGGGAHFVKSGYKHNNPKIGHCLIHPGRLTHYHAGLPTTKGKRYILVSFCE